MSWARAVIVISLVSLTAAVLVALVSRTPAAVRQDRPPPEATDPSLGASFTEDQIARHGAFRTTTYAGVAAALTVEIVGLLLVARAILPALLERARSLPGGWPVRALLAAIAVGLILWLVQLPLSYVRGFEVQHAWALSNQNVAGWFADQARSLLVGSVIAAVGALTFFGLVRWQPRTWWIWAWAGFTLLTALLFFLFPVLIAPLFNRFTPLADAGLRDEIKAVAQRAGVEVDEVLVADASRRSSVENAYVAGIGATKQVVLYDTLLEAGDEDETLFVVAHELGHESENHILKNLALTSLGLLAGFGVLAVLARSERFFGWAGADGIADPRVVPLLMLFATVAGLLLLPAQNAVSRSFESRADEIALELTVDPSTAVRVQRRLAFSNLADLRPPQAAIWLLYSHPPVRDRIEAALAHRRSEP